jgi:hypothetical protein
MVGAAPPPPAASAAALVLTVTLGLLVVPASAAQALSAPSSSAAPPSPLPGCPVDSLDLSALGRALAWATTPTAVDGAWLSAGVPALGPEPDAPPSGEEVRWGGARGTAQAGPAGG